MLDQCRQLNIEPRAILYIPGASNLCGLQTIATALCRYYIAYGFASETAAEPLNIRYHVKQNHMQTLDIERDERQIANVT